MKEYLRLKIFLLVQSLSPVFLVMVIRHFHLDFFFELPNKFISVSDVDFIQAIIKTFSHKEFGEVLIFTFGIIWLVISWFTKFAFDDIQKAGFKSEGDIVDVIEEKRGDASTFLFTFVLPLLIDELSSPQYYISYFLVITLVCLILYKSNLYYQSPILALLGYKVFVFKVKNPRNPSEMSPNKNYIGITKNKYIESGSVILLKYISDDVFFVYSE